MAILAKQGKTAKQLPLANGEKLLTVADVAALPDELPTGPVRYELNNGKLVIMTPPGGTHGNAEARFTGKIFVQGEERGLGKVFCGDVGIVLWHNPDRLVGADVAFVASRSLPVRFTPEGYLETIPDLVVEVRSKNDTDEEIAGKVRDYLKAGVALVWVADPAKKTVTAHRRGRRPKVFREADTLTAEDIVPGFRVLVSDVFQL